MTEDKCENGISIGNFSARVFGFYLFDLLFYGQFFLFIIASMINAFFVKTHDVKKFFLIIACFFTSIFASYFTFKLEKKYAMHTLETLVTACKNYQKKYQAYPEKLENLVPEFLPSIPRAKCNVFWGNFSYERIGNSPSIWCTIFPPFLRYFYDLKQDAYGVMD